MFTVNLGEFLENNDLSLEEAHSRQGERRLIDSDQETDEEMNDMGVAKCLKDLELMDR